jgi:hypothetical protein
MARKLTKGGRSVCTNLELATKLVVEGILVLQFVFLYLVKGADRLSDLSAVEKKVRDRASQFTLVQQGGSRVLMKKSWAIGRGKQERARVAILSFSKVCFFSFPAHACPCPHMPTQTHTHIHTHTLTPTHTHTHTHAHTCMHACTHTHTLPYGLMWHADVAC